MRAFANCGDGGSSSLPSHVSFLITVASLGTAGSRVGGSVVAARGHKLLIAWLLLLLQSAGSRVEELSSCGSGL